MTDFGVNLGHREGGSSSSAAVFEGIDAWQRVNLFRCNLRRRVAARDVKGLVGLLDHGDWHIRVAAIRALEELEDAMAIAPLIRCLADSDGRVRAEATRVLRRMAAQLARLFS
jgi:HEAT repeat protein